MMMCVQIPQLNNTTLVYIKNALTHIKVRMKSKFSPMRVCKRKYETCYYNLYSTRSYKLQHVQADVKSFPKYRVAFSSTLLCIV